MTTRITLCTWLIVRWIASTTLENFNGTAGAPIAKSSKSMSWKINAVEIKC